MTTPTKNPSTNTVSSLFQELQWRGYINQYTSPELFELYEQGGQTFYLGIDPTADSIHLGNIVQLMHAIQYMKRGNRFILIVGGATGMIGDPGGRDSERTFLDEATLVHNVAGITNDITQFLHNVSHILGQDLDITVINNMDFYRDVSYIQFLREVGKHITINQMMNKETVKRRIEDPNASISYTEFSYMLMQAYDFYILYTQHNCRLQIAGSDQWGNLVTGIELIKKKTTQTTTHTSEITDTHTSNTTDTHTSDIADTHLVYGSTGPLVLDAQGKKFGKSAGNALWLNEEKNHPYIIYQYFINTHDEDVARYLGLLTLLTQEQIEEITTIHATDPSRRYGQQQLAHHVTSLLFGQQAAIFAQTISYILYTKDTKQNKEATLNSLTPAQRHSLAQAAGKVYPEHPKHLPLLLDIIVDCELFPSRGEAKQAIKSGAISLNDEKITDIAYKLGSDDRTAGDTLIIKKGKQIVIIYTQ